MKISVFFILLLISFTAVLHGEELSSAELSSLDTLVTMPEDLSSNDTIITAPKELSSDNDSLIIDEINIPSAETALSAVTEISDVKKSETLLGLGAGMSIGSIPLFTLWQNSLPDSISHIGIAPEFGRVDAVNDTFNLRYVITEAPEVFNLFFPLTAYVYNIKDDRIASLGLSFFYTSKQFQAMIHPELVDTLERRVNIDEKLSLYSFALEVGYQKAIPPEYFSITGSEKTLFSASLAATPFNMFKRSGNVKTSVPESDERMQAVAENVRKNITDLSSNGKALSWRLGLTTLRRYNEISAVEMGLFYGGSYSALFYDKNGSRTRKGQIHIAENERDKNLTFLQSRIELRMVFLRSLCRERKRGSLLLRDDINSSIIDHNSDNDNNDMDDES
ncbi:MAG: hypothetical protein FWE57_12040 [Chitinispirillia bacterium]|nr:hypothetical protein [Chitinispirillia bacterium]